MNILFLIDTLEPGGAEYQLLQLAKSLTKRGHFCYVIALAPGRLEEIYKKTVRTTVIERRFRYDLSPIFSIARIIRQENIEVIHSWLWLSNIFARLSASLVGNKNVITSERGLLEQRTYKDKLRLFVENLLQSKSAYIVTNSEKMKYELCNYKYALEKIQVIQNGIDLDNFMVLPNREDSIQRLKISNSTSKIIGSVGRLEPIKDHETFVRAARIVYEHDKNVRFVIVGSGSLQIYLTNLIQRLGLADVFSLTGFLGDVTQFINGIDIYVHCSLHEALPNSILEAMAAGKPIIATNVGGIPEIVQDSVNGYLIPPNNPFLLAQSIMNLINNPAQKSTFEIEAKNRANIYSLEKMVDQYTDLYASLIKH